MIKYNSNTISDWNYGSNNIVKVYRNNAVCYYKITSGDTPTPVQEPCFAVVDDISQYSDTEFEDVFNKADGKWYKLNNLNQYEEYGVYGSGRNVTTYNGKLTIDDGYEYEWNGSSWINLGEVSGSTKIIKSPEYIQRTSTYNGYCSLLEYLTEDTKIIIKHRQTNAGGGRIIGDYNSNDSDDWRFFFYGSTLYYDFITQRQSTSKSMPMSAAEEWEVGNYYIKNTATGTNLLTGTPQTFSSRPAPLYIYHSDGVGAGESGADYGEIYYIKIYKNNVLVRDFIPWTDMNGNYGLYDKVEGELVHTVGNMTASTVINDVEVGGGGEPEYPMYYDEIQDPPNNLVFSSMTEAEDYECPWVGMTADIDNTDYIFDVSYQWVTKYGLFEVSGEYICDNGDKYKKMEEKIRNVDDTWSSQNPPVYEKGELVESASTDCSTYTELTYIQLSDSSSRGGVQLLNTPKEGLLIEIDFEMSGSTATGDVEIIGQKDGQETVSYQMGFMQYNSWTRAFYDYGGGRLSINTCPSFTTRRTWRIGRISGSTNPNIVGYYCDGTVGTKSVSTLQFDANRPYIIGNIAYNGSSVPQIGGWNIKPMKLYSVKIYEDYGVTLVGDYIPVLKEDGTTLTLYDKVSGNYANPFGTIIAGPSV